MCNRVDHLHCTLYNGQVKTIREQLLQAFLATGWTYDQLLSKCGLEVDVTSLFRKMKGEQTLSTTEAESLAIALCTTIAFAPTAKRTRARAKRAA